VVVMLIRLSFSDLPLWQRKRKLPLWRIVRATPHPPLTPFEPSSKEQRQVLRFIEEGSTPFGDGLICTTLTRPVPNAPT
jgi:alkylated DNA nucleotide flippase Atl1